MIVQPWQGTDPDRLLPLYVREQEYWLDTFSWDTSSHWTEIERARLTWGLPGLVAVDPDGACQGWCFFIADGDVVHLGGLVASTPDATDALLDRVLDGEDDGTPAGGVYCFMPDRAPGVHEALASRGFDVEPHLYLDRDLVMPGLKPRPEYEIDAWRVSDIQPLAALLRSSYPDDAGRHFAPNNEPEEWGAYARSLVDQTGCGVFQPTLTRVVRQGRTLAGAIVITQIGPHTAHIAQLAVHPSHRGQGIAAALLSDALDRAAAAGMARVTLLVAESNRPARALYDAHGFVSQGRFVAARRATT